MEQIVITVTEQVAQQGEAIPLPTKTISIDYAKFIFSVVKAMVVSLLSNPYVLLALSLIASYFFFYMKRKVKKLQKEAAKRQTEKDYADKIEEKMPENKTSNEKDNSNREKLDKIE